MTAGIEMALSMPLARRTGETRMLAIGAAYVAVVMLSLPLWVEHLTFLGFMVTGTFTFSLERDLLRSIKFGGDDLPVFTALFAWMTWDRGGVL